MQDKFESVDEYIASFHERQQQLLQQIRSTIKKAAPKATECISYNMPAYRQHGVLVYFAAHKKHIGFFPPSMPIKIFTGHRPVYQTSKGDIHIPFYKPIPATLVKKIVKYRMEEDAMKALAKKKK